MFRASGDGGRATRRELTDVAVLASPAGQTLAEVASDQIAAGLGVLARTVLALVGVCRGKIKIK